MQRYLSISAFDRFLKRTFDVVVSAVGLTALSWVILLSYVIASIDTGMNGFFVQTRIGKHGRPFPLIKIRTMRPICGHDTVVTTTHDPRITRIGGLLRKMKVDELPQLFNVLVGHMSFVGPRPDVPGFADCLEGDDRIILSVRPGITGPATLRFRDEERELAGQADPEEYNREVIYPEKVRLNKLYVRNYSFTQDIRYILATLFG
ncbi:sugar transferase [Syntrophobacter fumaroxidans]|nr:sugar transferase [Syntrophobacter fumaroxidans]